MSSRATEPPSIDLEEAIALARAAVASADPRTQRAIYILIRHARRGSRLSSSTLAAVRSTVSGTTHFERVRHEIATARALIGDLNKRLADLEAEVLRGMDAVGAGARVLRQASSTPTPSPGDEF